MSKNVIFCADGTWNGAGNDENGDGVPDITNVLKLYQKLDGQTTAASARLQDEQEKALVDASGQVLQIAKYLHGVGDSRNAVQRVVGGVFGAGFVQRIVRGYTFLSRNWLAGDAIFVLGFSRGAYTARALAGMVGRMVLLPPKAMLDDSGNYDAERAYRLGLSVWAQHRKLLGKKSPLLDYLEEFHAIAVDASTLLPATLKAVAVWDTVGSLGIPTYGEDDDSLRRDDLYGFADLDLSEKVAVGLHAVSIDECRRDFEPTLWNDRHDVEQVLFAGAHADVGGGYPEAESVLSDCALYWMTARLKTQGVRFSPFPDPTPVPLTMPHHTPWTAPPFEALGTVLRKFADTGKFHRSVQLRLDQYDGYAPANIPPACFSSARVLRSQQVVD